MYSFEPKPNPSSQKKSSESAGTGRERLRQSKYATSGSPPSDSLGRDFSQIPIHDQATHSLPSRPAVNSPESTCRQCGADRPIQRKSSFNDGHPEKARGILGLAHVPVSAPGGADELEADRVADAVTSGANSGPIESRPIAAGTVARSTNGGAPSPASSTTPIPHSWIPSAGAPLPFPIRAQMETGFNRSFEQVRIHRGSEAAAMASSLHATAYTLGSHVVLGEKAPSFDSDAGRRLLAHELTHTVQQEGSHANPIQRTLTVVGTQPTTSDLPDLAGRTDPAASLTPAQRLATMNSQVTSLCPGFRVNSGTGVVEATTNPAPSRAARNAGTSPVGCCCLDVLTASPNPWRIFVSQVVSPFTNPAAHFFVLPPSATPLDLGSYTAGGTYAVQGPHGIVPTMGHELCGHGALGEIGAHPIGGDRDTTDIHDPTVRIENAVSLEQGVPSSDLRGLAASGAHRGESADRLVVGNYAVNATSIPSSERANIAFAGEYILANRPFVSVVGHSDSSGSASAKQSVSQNRANEVTRVLNTAISGASPRITVNTEGAADREPPNGNSSAPQSEWRRVEIFMSSHLAGSRTPPPVAAPGARTEAPGLLAAQTSVDPCVKRLATTAIP